MDKKFDIVSWRFERRHYVYLVVDTLIVVVVWFIKTSSYSVSRKLKRVSDKIVIGRELPNSVYIIVCAYVGMRKELIRRKQDIFDNNNAHVKS